MTKEKYSNAVNKVLDEFKDSVVFKLNRVLNSIPPDTRGMSIEIFVDQDGEGFLDISVSLEGPDHYVLNKEIAADRELFLTRMTDAGLKPPLPLMGREESFNVNDVLTDCAAKWVQSIWPEVVIGDVTVPISLESHDQFGEICPVYLN